MNPVLIAFFMAAGVATWIYSKVIKSNGGQAKPALIVAGSVGVFVLLIMWWLMSALS